MGSRVKRSILRAGIRRIRNAAFSGIRSPVYDIRPLKLMILHDK